jgi:hypothetical protein
MDVLCGLRPRGERRGWCLLNGDEATPNEGLYLLEGAHLDLADPFSRDPEFSGKVFQCNGAFDQPARLENAAFAIVEYAQRIVQSGAAIL